MKRQNLREWLKSFGEDKIIISSHVAQDRAYRGIKEEVIRQNLMNPKNLIRATEQESLNPSEFKYKLWFRLSRARTLGLIITLNERIKVKTAYEIVNKWQKRMWWK